MKMKSIGILFVFLSISAFGLQIVKEKACEEGWEAICTEDTCTCYQFFDGNLRYDVAKQICKALGADLPSIHSEKENRIVYVAPSRYDKGAWLGLTRNSSFTFVWSDGTPFDYSNWQADSPSNGADDSDCVHFLGFSDNGFSAAFEWGDSPCTDLRPVICQKAQTPFVPSTTPSPVPPCPGKYTMHCLSTGQCNCYRAVLTYKRWQDAVSFCRGEGTDLISIYSQEEDEFAENLVSGYSAWVGITYGDELWSDGSVISYSNWFTNYTNGYAAYYGIGNTDWFASDLGTSNYSTKYFICKTAAQGFKAP